MNNRESTLLRPALRAVMLLFLSVLVPLMSFSQYNSMFYVWDDFDAKNYTTRAIPSSNFPRESIMAGTLFDASTGLGVPHFLKCNDGGAPANNYPGITAEATYPHAHFVDQRVVDIVSAGHDEHYIVALARRDVSNPMAAPFNDVIRVIKVDDAGDNTAPGYGDLVIDDLNFGQGNLNIYPMSAMYRTTVDPNTLENRKVLYICGFVSSDATQHPNYPDMNSEKRSFILALNIGGDTDPANANPPGTWTLINANYFETSPCTAAMAGCTNNSPELDWDIAMHMQTLKVSAHNIGDIFMTGSVNAMTGQYNGFGYPYTFVRSGSMVLVLDPWTLTDVATAANPTHIVDLGNLDGYGRMEYGVALVEASSGTDNYLISNIYEAFPSGDGSPTDDWLNTIGFNEKPGYIAITHLSEDFESTYLTVSSRRRILDQAQFGGIGLYALDVLPSQEVSSGANGTRNPVSGSDVKFIIAGMAYNTPQSNNCYNDITGYGQRAISAANMNPFLYTVDISWDRQIPWVSSLGDIVYNQFSTIAPYGSYINIYPTQRGTGDPAAFTNAYALLGGGLSHIAWAPDFADIDPTDLNSIIMNAPRWSDGNADGTVQTRLGLKTMFVNATDGSFLSMDFCVRMRCDPVTDTSEVELIDHTDGPHDIRLSDPHEAKSSVAATPRGECSDNPPVYKPAGIEQLGNAIAKIYPNPASDNIYVQIAGEVKGTVNVRMMNIYGQAVGELYNGDAGGLRQKNNLSLPAVAPGLYMVQVFANGQMVHQERLSVHQR